MLRKSEVKTRSTAGAILALWAMLCFPLSTASAGENGSHPMRFDRLTLDQGLSLEVIHPTLPNQDQSIQLAPLDGARFAGRLEPLGPANWKLALRPQDRSWRIEGRLPQPGSGDTRLD